jgi:hypothetical protein
MSSCKNWVANAGCQQRDSGYQIRRRRRKALLASPTFAIAMARQALRSGRDLGDHGTVDVIGTQLEEVVE